MKSKESKTDLSRRDFIKTTAVGVSATALAGMGAVKAQDAVASTIPGVPDRWDYEADVVVVGHGFAAQAAAIEAERGGASVLMLEKAPEALAGGNSRVCGQGFISPSPKIWDDYFAYLKEATEGQGMPTDNDPALSDAILRFYIEESSKSIQWFRDLGAEVIESLYGRPNGSWIPFYGHFPGADAIATEPGSYQVGGKYLSIGYGMNWFFLEDCIKERKGIKCMYQAPVTKLVQHPVTKEILGVVAESGWEKYPREIFVKAKKAVCVCNGGWEFNDQMIRDFQHIQHCYSPGGPFNTGDGIKMCWEVGADLRNMGVITAPSGISGGLKPGFKATLSISEARSTGASIVVGANNKRWRDEFGRPSVLERGGIARKNLQGQEGWATGVFTMIENGVYVRDKFPMPIHMIFDEACRVAAPIFGGSFSARVEGFVASKDNSVELEKGWFVKADTIEELATKIGREPKPLYGRVPLRETIDKWNGLCAAGKDTDYGRTKNLTPFTNGPFYAVQLYPSCLNTQGGMRRNTKAEVLDIRGKPIPRLYSAGENGDIWTVTYQCMSNVGGGCYGFGRVAGQNAAALEPWG